MGSKSANIFSERALNFRPCASSFARVIVGEDWLEKRIPALQVSPRIIRWLEVVAEETGRDCERFFSEE